jgi:hypothetical protein
MMPSIATKFQYVNSFLFSFSLATCFGPYGPSSGEIYNWMLHHEDIYFNIFLHTGLLSTDNLLFLQFYIYNVYICIHVITCIGYAKSGRRCTACNISASGRTRATDPLY